MSEKLLFTYSNAGASIPLLGLADVDAVISVLASIAAQCHLNTVERDAEKICFGFQSW